MEASGLAAQLGALAESYGWKVWLAVSIAVAVFLFLRYVALVAAAEWYARRPRQLRRQVYRGQKARRADQTRRELAYAAATSAVFGVSTAVLLYAWQSGWLRLYMYVEEYSLLWLPLSLVLAMLLHETYYYWLHRALHHPTLYGWLHRGHHDSIVTSGWTSFAFDPGEAVLQAAIIPVILLLVPMHWAVLVVWLMLMTVSAIINHLGVELWPQPLERTWWGRNVIGATHHSLHHTRFVRNYGLYFTFWDRWMGTEAEG